VLADRKVCHCGLGNFGRSIVSGARFQGILVAAAASLVMVLPMGLEGQQPRPSIEHMEMMYMNLRPAGQPVIPLFDGWYQKEDGSYDLCFGYFNLNTREDFNVPRGPDNFLEPARFDGPQPTYFQEIPEGYRRYFCVFTVNLSPEDRNERVVWSITTQGFTHSVPGHIGARSSQMEEPIQASREAAAPVLSFLEPAGPSGVGRTGFWSDPVTTSVGAALSIAVDLVPMTGQTVGSLDILNPDDDPDDTPTGWWVTWAKHGGPGEVAFAPPSRAFGPQEIVVAPGERVARTSVTFTEPGEYMLRVQAADSRGTFTGGFHCCWTNAYVHVTVTP